MIWQLTPEQAEHIWSELEETSWKGLREILEDHTVRVLLIQGDEPLDEETLDALLEETIAMDEEGEDFPMNAEELRDLFNEQLAERRVEPEPTDHGPRYEEEAS